MTNEMAIDMAKSKLKCLEMETSGSCSCDDAISREAVYSILNEHHIDEDRIKSDMDERQNLTVNSIASDVSLLPSVTQKSAESEDKTE